jgi:hypothetical protein
MLSIQPVSYYGSSNQTNSLFFPFSSPTSFYPMSSNFTFGLSDTISNLFYNPYYPSETTFFSKSYYPCGREKEFPKHFDKNVDFEIEITIQQSSSNP